MQLQISSVVETKGSPAYTGDCSDGSPNVILDIFWIFFSCNKRSDSQAPKYLYIYFTAR